MSVSTTISSWAYFQREQAIDDSTLPYFVGQHLLSLDLTNCSFLTQSGFALIAKEAPSLEELRLSLCRQLDDKLMSQINDLFAAKRLRALFVGSNGRLSDESICM